jgi:hypothetical protein
MEGNIFLIGDQMSQEVFRSEFKPYLLQRCKLKKVEGKPTISELFKLDYMGSSEFEWGAIPHAIMTYAKELRKPDFVDAFFVVEVPRLGKTFSVHCLASQLKEVQEFVKKFEESNYPAHLKEALHLDSKPGRYDHVDFWFDLEHFFVFTTCDVSTLYRFREAIFASEQKILQNRGEQEEAKRLKNEAAIAERDKRVQENKEAEAKFKQDFDRLTEMLKTVDSSKAYQISMILKETNRTAFLKAAARI